MAEEQPLDGIPAYIRGLAEQMKTPNQPDLPNGPDLAGWLRVFPDLYKFGSSETAQLTLTTIGGVVVIYCLLQVINWLLSVIQSPRLAIYRHAGNESWALVTGASDGIGKAFSEELLRRGYNVLLHGRNAQKLEKFKKDLQSQWPKRQLDVVVADASKYDNAHTTLAKKCHNLPNNGKLTILINNVGGQITFPRYLPLSEVPHADLDTTINVNARFPTHLTASLIPLLRANSPSLIINCGSTAGVMGTPYIATYSGTKAYLHAFTAALAHEMHSDGTPDVDVAGFVIGNTATTGNPHALPFFTLTARDCAASCLDRVGKGGGPVVWSHWRHALQYNVSRVLPKRVVDGEMMRLMRKRVEEEKAAVGSARKDL